MPILCTFESLEKGFDRMWKNLRKEGIAKHGRKGWHERLRRWIRSVMAHYEIDEILDFYEKYR